MNPRGSTIESSSRTYEGAGTAAAGVAASALPQARAVAMAAKRETTVRSGMAGAMA
jgi:hypothetical protein